MCAAMAARSRPVPWHFGQYGSGVAPALPHGNCAFSVSRLINHPSQLIVAVDKKPEARYSTPTCRYGTRHCSSNCLGSTELHNYRLRILNKDSALLLGSRLTAFLLVKFLKVKNNRRSGDRDKSIADGVIECWAVSLQNVNGRLQLSSPKLNVERMLVDIARWAAWENIFNVVVFRQKRLLAGNPSNHWQKMIGMPTLVKLAAAIRTAPAKQVIYLLALLFT